MRCTVHLPDDDDIDVFFIPNRERETEALVPLRIPTPHETTA